MAVLGTFGGRIAGGHAHGVGHGAEADCAAVPLLVRIHELVDAFAEYEHQVSVIEGYLGTQPVPEGDIEGPGRAPGG